MQEEVLHIHSSIKHCDDHPFASSNFINTINTNNLWNIECCFHPNALDPIKCRLLNWRSICNKITIFYNLLLNQKLDICAPMETWIKEENITANKHVPYGYSCL